MQLGSRQTLLPERALAGEQLAVQQPDLRVMAADQLQRRGGQQGVKAAGVGGRGNGGVPARQTKSRQRRGMGAADRQNAPIQPGKSFFQAVRRVGRLGRWEGFPLRRRQTNGGFDGIVQSQPFRFAVRGGKPLPDGFLHGQ